MLSFSGIRKQVIRVEGKHTDLFITTSTQQRKFFKVHSDLLLAVNIAETLLIPHLSGCCGVVSAHEPSPQLTAFRSQSV